MEVSGSIWGSRPPVKQVEPILEGDKLIKINIQQEHKTMADAFNMTHERTEEIVTMVKSHEKGKITNTIQWACFTEELRNLNERVFAIYVIGGDSSINHMMKMIGGGD